MSVESAARHPDAIVIGGGIIGSSIALRLAQAGLHVSVFDRGRAGREASSAAAGMIAPQGERMASAEFDDLCRMSHASYPQFVAEIEALSGAAVNYRRDGTLLLALDAEQARELDGIAAAAQVSSEPSGVGRASAGRIERLGPEAARQRVPGLTAGIRAALFVADDHWVDNELLTQAVIEAARRQGVVFEENTPVHRIEVRQGRVEGIETDHKRVSIAEVILAAGCWSSALAAGAGVEIPIAPCRGQMIEFELPAPLPLVVRSGHSYLVPRAGNSVIVGTTAEYVSFENTVTAGGLATVLQGALRLTPFLADGRFRRAWAGLRPDTADHLPVLGRSSVRGLTLATGHFRNGILLAPVTARLIRDLVVNGVAAPALDAFCADRFATAARAATGASP
jgi:glycine oxidase